VLLATSLLSPRTARGDRRLPPHAKINFAGGTSDLESLKSGKDKDKTLVCTQSNETSDGFPPRTEPPPASQREMRPRAFGMITLWHFSDLLTRLRAQRLPAYSSPTSGESYCGTLT